MSAFDKQVHYKVIQCSSTSDLNQKVQDKIKEGYVPVGSHQVVVKNQLYRYRGSDVGDIVSELEYSQTMMKEV